MKEAMIDFLTIRKAQDNDYDAFYQLRCEKENIFWSGHCEKPDYNNFRQWYCTNIDKIYIADVKNVVVGYAYVTILSNSAELSIGVSNQHTGKGYASNIIHKLVQDLVTKFKEIYAFIFETNIASQKVFLKNSFVKTAKSQEVYKAGVIEKQFKYIYKK